MTHDIDLLESFLPAEAEPSPELQQFRKGIVGDASKESPYRVSSVRAGQPANTMRGDCPACCVFMGLFGESRRLYGALVRQERQLGVLDVESLSALKAPFASGLRGLFLTVHENPFRDPRLNVYLDQFIQNFIQLLAEIGAIVQAGEDERLESNFRAVREVFQHRLISFHSRVSVRQPRAHAGWLGTQGYTLCIHTSIPKRTATVWVTGEGRAVQSHAIGRREGRTSGMKQLFLGLAKGYVQTRRATQDTVASVQMDQSGMRLWSFRSGGDDGETRNPKG